MNSTENARWRMARRKGLHRPPAGMASETRPVPKPPPHRRHAVDTAVVEPVEAACRDPATSIAHGGRRWAQRGAIAHRHGKEMARRIDRLVRSGHLDATTIQPGRLVITLVAPATPRGEDA